MALPGTHGVLLPHKFLEWLLLYTVTTLTYSLYLKRTLLLDVFVLSGLYTVRILAGSAATTVPISEWLGGFSVFFFLSLAFVKRFSELESLRERGGAAPAGRGYHIRRPGAVARLWHGIDVRGGAGDDAVYFEPADKPAVRHMRSGCGWWFRCCCCG